MLLRIGTYAVFMYSFLGASLPKFCRVTHLVARVNVGRQTSRSQFCECRLGKMPILWAKPFALSFSEMSEVLSKWNFPSRVPIDTKRNMQSVF